MPTIFLLLAIAAGLWIAWAVMRGRLGSAENRIAAAKRRAQSYKPAVLKVSPVDGAFIGLCFDKGIIAVGDADADMAWSLYMLDRIELVLNDETIAEAGSATRKDPGPFQGVVHDLALRVSVKDPEYGPYLIRFLQWPAPGLKPNDPVVRDVATEAFDIFQRLAEGLTKARAARGNAPDA